MLTYYLPGPESFTIRTQDLNSSNLTLKLENMYTLETSSYALTYTFNSYENLMSFDLQLISASVAGEYRAYIEDVSGSIWNGSIQVYESQSVDKADYRNQNTQYVSHQSTNRYTEYIIM